MFHGYGFFEGSSCGECEAGLVAAEVVALVLRGNLAAGLTQDQ